MTTLTAIVLVPLFGAFFIACLSSKTDVRNKYFFALFPFLSFLLLLGQMPLLEENGFINEKISWYTSLGISASFTLDYFSLIMGLLVTGIGTLVLIYAHGYMKGSPHVDRFYVTILIFMAAMLGVVLSENLLLLFVFWELTTITSYLLVGYNHENESARKSAQQALLVTGIGGLVLLAGILVLGGEAGTYEISAIKGKIGELDKTVLNVAAGLFLVGCFTKSAQFPFHFWLPNAMAAPTPVSSYLHSATMVKAGVYLIYRMNEVFIDLSYWTSSLLMAGSLTMFFGALCGLFYRDLKKILAYSTISVLGALTYLAGIGSELSMITGIAVLIGHAFYKATLFMVAGSVDHEAGTREIYKLSGLRKAMPYTSIAALLACLSQAGIPPFFGFVGKEYMYKSNLYSDYPVLLSIIIVSASVLLILLALTCGLHIFSGKEVKYESKHIHEAPISMLIGPLVLATLGLITGFIPGWLSENFLKGAAANLGFGYEKNLYLWEGVNTALILSIVTVALGALCYWKRQNLWVITDKIIAKGGFRFEKLFAFGLNSFVNFSKFQTRVIQNGSLKSYLLISVTGFLILLSGSLIYVDDIPYSVDFSGIPFYHLLLVIVMAGSALFAAFSKSLVFSIISLGILGFSLPVIYMYYGAPDLAITQILVETLTVVMFMAVVYKLPAFKWRNSFAQRVADFAFASIAGFMVTLLILKAQALQFDDPVSEKMNDLSYLEAKGKNIVNVILVDFRALDTLGEVTVLLIAVIGGAILVKRSSKGEEA